MGVRCCERENRNDRSTKDRMKKESKDLGNGEMEEGWIYNAVSLFFCERREGEKRKRITNYNKNTTIITGISK